MLKAFKYRLYPTDEQMALINQHIGASRFVYNLALEVKSTAWKNHQVSLTSFDLTKQLVGLKEECPWLKDLNAQTLQQSIRNLDVAFANFFQKRAKYPKFKKKSNRGSFNVPQSVCIKDGKLSIPKFREGIDIILHRPLKGKIKQATVSKTPTGKYFVSILCDTGEDIQPKAKIEPHTTLGIDLGIKTFIVTSNGQTFDNPKYLRKALSKLKYVQRRYSKYKGKRTKLKLAKIHEKVTNQRKDFLHKLSTLLIRENQSIAIESLNVKGMIQNHNLAQAISDAGWGMFVELCKYKADWLGKNIVEIGRFDPSSKMHSKCGFINDDLTLADREWLCPNCNEMVDRDFNAAINIKTLALSKIIGLGSTDLKSQRAAGKSRSVDLRSSGA